MSGQPDTALIPHPTLTTALMSNTKFRNRSAGSQSVTAVGMRNKAISRSVIGVRRLRSKLSYSEGQGLLLLCGWLETGGLKEARMVLIMSRRR